MLEYNIKQDRGTYKIIENPIFRIIILLVLCLNLSFLVFYQFFSFETIFHTDAATKNILAAEILQTGQYFPNDWHYANGDIWVGLLLWPLLAILLFVDNYYLAHAYNSLFYFLLYLIAWLYYLKALKLQWHEKQVILLLVISGYSFFYAAFMFGEVAYINIMTAMVFILAVFERFKQNKDSGIGLAIILALVLFLFTIHNAKRALIYEFLPIAIACFLLIKNQGLSKRNIILFSTNLMAFILGAACYFSLLAKLNNINGATYISTASFEQFIQHLKVLWDAIFFHFQVLDDPHIPLFSLMGILSCLNFVFFSFFVYLSYQFFSIRGFFQFHYSKQLLVAFFFYFFIIIGYLYLFTTPLAQDRPTLRYLYPLFLLGLLALAFGMREINRKYRFVVLMLLFGYLTWSNFIVYVGPTFDEKYQQKPIVHKEVAQYLVSQEIEFGYASYWNSYVVTIFANGKPIIAPIHLDAIEPNLWLSSKRWYVPNEAKKYALILSDEEYQQYYANILKKIGLPSYQKQIYTKRVLIYEKNLSKILFKP